MKLSGQEWAIMLALVGVASLVGLLSGYLALSLLGAAACWIVLQQREFNALVRWSQKPLVRPMLQLESWSILADRLYRTHRGARVRTRRALENFNRLRVITDALPDAAIMLDHTGAIESFNSAAEGMLHLVHSDRGSNLAALIRQTDFAALARGRPADGIIEFPSPFDDNRRLEARRIPLGGDRANHALILVRDVTQLNRLLTMRQDFIANVSHELRTPLTVIVGYLETLSGDDLDPDTMRQLLGKLETPTLRMRALVDDLLLLSRLEANPVPEVEALEPIEMAGLIRACVAEARALSAGRHRFATHIDRTLRLRGQESEIYSAVLNIVTNAVRYSPDGGVIELTWQRAGAGARLGVRDQGIGIAPEHIQRITERFFRVDLARSRVRGGTGLGLAIVKHVLKRHRSCLEVSSEPGRGSLFQCTFPPELVPGDDAGEAPGGSTPSHRTMASRQSSTVSAPTDASSGNPKAPYEDTP